MLKKVKAKQYKSKREFKDDLDLIWSNCFTYNATEVGLSIPVPFFRYISLSILYFHSLSSLTGSPPSTMCDTLKEQGRRIPREHNRPQGTRRSYHTP